MQGLGWASGGTPPLAALMLTKIARNVLAPLSSLTLCAALFAAPLPASAGPIVATAGVPAALVSARALDSASVLGLKGDDAKKNEALTASLREAFAARNMGGGDELTLEEVMLTMGCESKDNAACMTEAGQAIGVDKLIYGELSKSGDGYTLDIVVLVTSTGMVESQTSAPLSKTDLNKENIDETAAEIVSSLYPGDDEEVVAAPPPMLDAPAEETQPEEPPPEKESDYIWGRYSPRPRWKKIGLGVSAGVAAVGLGTVIVTAILLNGFEADVRQGASNSLADNDPNDPQTFDNDVVAGSGQSLCRAAGYPPEDGGIVVHKETGEACQAGDVTRKINVAGFAVFGVGVAATIAFTLLYFVHKREGAATKASKRRVRMTAGGGRSGFSLGARGRF